MKGSAQLRMIAFKEGDQWVGQVLEHDIGAQAPTLDELHHRLEIAIGLELEESLKRHGKPFAGIDPAPRHYHEMWEKRAGQFQPTDQARGTVKSDGSSVQVEMALCA